MIRSLTELPSDVLLQIVEQAPALALCCKSLFALENEIWRHKLMRSYGPGLEDVLVYSSREIKEFVQMNDCFYKYRRQILSEIGGLRRFDAVRAQDLDYCEYLADSWRLVYRLITYKKLYMPTEYSLGETQVKRSEETLDCDFHTLVLPGSYILWFYVSSETQRQNLGLIDFVARFEELGESPQEFERRFIVPLNIDDLVPSKCVIALNMGSFTVPGTNPWKLDIKMFCDGHKVIDGYRLHYLELTRTSHGMAAWNLDRVLYFACDIAPDKVVNLYEKRATQKIEEGFKKHYGVGGETVPETATHRDRIPSSQGPSNHEYFENYGKVFYDRSEKPPMVRFQTPADQNEFNSRSNLVFLKNFYNHSFEDILYANSG